MICGVDEAGRGPIAGPVIASAVILAAHHSVGGIRDSKQLSARQRERLSFEIRRSAIAWAIGRAEVEEIDAINILQASLLAMKRAVEGLDIAPREVWVDGVHVPRLSCPAKAIVRGDQHVEIIAAASILAKTERDKEMLKAHERYPQYAFDRHKGYATALHLQRIKLYGICPLHRATFAPVRRVVRLENEFQRLD